MSISPLNGTVANPAQVTPPVRTDQHHATAQTPHAAEKAIKAAKTDTVTISPQAVQLASDGDTAAQETKESGGEKVSETARGKK